MPRSAARAQPAPCCVQRSEMGRGARGRSVHLQPSARLGLQVCCFNAATCTADDEVTCPPPGSKYTSGPFYTNFTTRPQTIPWLHYDNSTSTYSVANIDTTTTTFGNQFANNMTVIAGKLTLPDGTEGYTDVGLKKSQFGCVGINAASFWHTKSVSPPCFAVSAPASARLFAARQPRICSPHSSESHAQLRRAYARQVSIQGADGNHVRVRWLPHTNSCADQLVQR